MPSKYAKIQKHVTKKKGAAKLTALHEESRDARRLRKAVVRDDRVARMSAVREKANENYRTTSSVSLSLPLAVFPKLVPGPVISPVIVLSILILSC